MKRMHAFIVLFVCSVLLLVSYLPGVYSSSYRWAVNIAGQIGMVAGLILFLLLPGKPKPPQGRNN